MTRPSTPARVKRAALAAAVAQYVNAACSDEADIAFEAVLVANGVTTPNDAILDIFADLDDDSLKGGVLIHLEEEWVTIDRDGNTARGGF